MLENAADELIDAEETEDLPVDSPDAEEVEEQLAEAEETEEQVVEEEPETNERMSRQLPSAGAVQQKDYHSKKADIEKIAALVGQDITIVTHKNGSMKGKVISTYEALEVNLINDSHRKCGMRDFNTMDYKKREVLVAMFLQLTGRRKCRK
jgi:hypothetical protein